MTSAYRASTLTPSSPAAAAMATICWASTSSALRGTTVVSIWPSRMRWATTAHSSRSARNFGKMRPLLVSPTLWPARPIRCRPAVTDLGDSTCSTRSIAPMSMPSSRLEVATRQGSSPAFSRSSTRRRSSRASEPWWARAIGSCASSLSLSASRSAPRRLLTKMRVLRCSLTRSSSFGIDRGPDRLAGRLHAGALERVELHVGVRLDHRLDRDVDLQVERLADAGVDDRAGALRADQEAADLLERVLGGGEADALDVPVRGLGQPLERERQVGAALGLRHRVDLVDDHLLGAVEDLRRLAGEHQVQRLGGGDEDVRRVADHRLALPLGRVAGADGDLDVGADAAERRAQVLLDVVGERLQRRDVDEAGAVGGRLGDHPVERPQEGGQRLARAGRRADQRVLAGGDRRPCLRLSRRGGVEGALEPLPDLRSEL